MTRSLTRNRSRLFAALAAVLLAGTAQANLLTNGSFELGGIAAPPPSPPAPPGDPFLVVNTGDSSTLFGWSVGGAVGVDWVRDAYWQSSNGNYSLDMNALGRGAISQTFATVAGSSYTVTYDLSLNPDTNVAFPTNRVLNVSATNVGTSAVDGSSSHTFPFNSVGSTYTNMNWQGYSFTFTASGSSTTLNFASGNDEAGGVALDNVSVTGAIAPPPDAIPAPAGLVLGLFGAAVGLRFRRRTATAAV